MSPKIPTSCEVATASQTLHAAAHQQLSCGLTSADEASEKGRHMTSRGISYHHLCVVRSVECGCVGWADRPCWSWDGLGRAARGEGVRGCVPRAQCLPALGSLVLIHVV